MTDRRLNGLPRVALAGGDGLSLLLFTVLGLRFHGVAMAPYEVLQTAVPLWAAWFASARLLETYQKRAAGPFLLNWLIAVPIALAVRQVWLGRPFGASFLVFLGVALALTLTFLASWRLLAHFTGRIPGRPRISQL